MFRVSSIIYCLALESIRACPCAPPFFSSIPLFISYNISEISGVFYGGLVYKKCFVMSFLMNQSHQLEPFYCLLCFPCNDMFFLPWDFQCEPPRLPFPGLLPLVLDSLLGLKTQMVSRMEDGVCLFLPSLSMRQKSQTPDKMVTGSTVVMAQFLRASQNLLLTQEKHSS